MNAQSPGSPAHVPWRRSLAARVGRAFILTVVLSLIIVGVGLVWIARQAQQQSIFQLQERHADKVALLISNHIGQAMEALTLFEGIEPLTTLPPDRQKVALENLLIERPTVFNQLALLDKDGTEVTKVSQSYTFMPGELGSQAGTDPFITAIGGKPYIGPVFVSPGSGLLSVQIGVPVKATGEQIVGVLTAEVNVARLWQEISRIEIGKTGYAYLVDTGGRFIAYQEPAAVLQRYGEDMRQMPPVAEFVASGPEESRHVYEYRGLIGEPVIGLYMPIQGTDWAVVVELPTREAYASVTRMQWYLASLTLLGVVVAGGLGFVIPRRLVRPIRALTDSATAIAGGDLSRTAPVEREDEVGMLARAFNSMTDQLRALIVGLEQRVAERTAELEHRAVQLRTAAEVSRAASSTLDPDRLLSQTVELIASRFNLYYAGLFLVDETGEWAVLQAATGEVGRQMLAQGHKLKTGGTSMVGWCIANAQARIALDVGEEAVRFDNPLLPDTRSEMALPLISRGRVIGALDVQSTKESAFTDEDIAVMQTMADQLANAIENARLFRQAQESLQAERRAYGELSREAWREMLHARSELGQRYDPQGILPPVGQWCEEMKLAMQKRETVVGKGSSSTTLATPFKVHGQIIGVLDAHKPAEVGAWTPEEISLLETLAEQLGIALESARLYQEARRREARERLIGEIAARMRETLDVETVLKTALRELGARLDLARVEVRLGSGRARPDTGHDRANEGSKDGEPD